ncbi:hypothetical protein GG344DRAFT_80176 [Lentinula edodes]|nr:hypothetical protein GG344DRAFT_80176 [Lentinula edodes]
MAPDPQCAALNAAKNRTAFSSMFVRTLIDDISPHLLRDWHLSRVTILDDPSSLLIFELRDIVCTGTVRPTTAEFNALARALGITDAVGHLILHYLLHPFNSTPNKFLLLLSQ